MSKGSNTMVPNGSRAVELLVRGVMGLCLFIALAFSTGCACGCGQGVPPPPPIRPPVVIPSTLPNPFPNRAVLPPEGWIFEATPCRLRGCAYDPKYPSSKITVTLYIDKLAIGSVTADREDRQCETVRGHGFAFAMSSPPAGSRVEIVASGVEPGDIKTIATATIVGPCN